MVESERTLTGHILNKPELFTDGQIEVINEILSGAKTYKQISDALGISVKAAQKRLIGIGAMPSMMPGIVEDKASMGVMGQIQIETGIRPPKSKIVEALIDSEIISKDGK